MGLHSIFLLAGRQTLKAGSSSNRVVECVQVTEMQEPVADYSKELNMAIMNPSVLETHHGRTPQMTD